MKLLTLLLTGLLPGQSLLITNPSISNAPILTMKLGRGMWLRRRPSVFGLIGGIASGKSTVSRTLEAEFGIAVIDADKLGHDSYQPGTRCFNNLVHVFGQGIVSDDGTINRRALGEAVFGNPSNMERLQNIVWPEIRLLAQQRISKLGQEGAESVVLEAAVLLEAGWDNLCDEIWTVQVSPDIARSRLMERNGLSEDQAEKRISSQPMTNEQRAARVMVVLSNEGTEAELVEKVKRTWKTRNPVLRSKWRRHSITAVALVGAMMTAGIASVLLRRGRGL